MHRVGLRLVIRDLADHPRVAAGRAPALLAQPCRREHAERQHHGRAGSDGRADLVGEHHPVQDIELAMIGAGVIAPSCQAGAHACEQVVVAEINSLVSDSAQQGEDK